MQGSSETDKKVIFAVNISEMNSRNKTMYIDIILMSINNNLYKMKANCKLCSLLDSKHHGQEILWYIVTKVSENEIVSDVYGTWISVTVSPTFVLNHHIHTKPRKHECENIRVWEISF